MFVCLDIYIILYIFGCVFVQVTPKHCYANPLDPQICMFTALACFLATADEKVTSTRMFGGDKEGLGTQK